MAISKHMSIIAIMTYDDEWEYFSNTQKHTHISDTIIGHVDFIFLPHCVISL